MIKLFSRYASVGVFNTLIHWVLFFLLVNWLSLPQAPSNLIAFAVAVTFSFFVNARFTFESKATTKGYMLFTSFMAAMSYLSGYISDTNHFPPIVTLVAFSAFSMIFGFLFSHFIVFDGGLPHKREK